MNKALFLFRANNGWKLFIINMLTKHIPRDTIVSIMVKSEIWTHSLVLYLFVNIHIFHIFSALLVKNMPRQHNSLISLVLTDREIHDMKSALK